MLICICVMLCIVALIEARMLLKLTSGKKSKGKVFEQLHGNDDVTESEHTCKFFLDILKLYITGFSLEAFIEIVFSAEVDDIECLQKLVKIVSYGVVDYHAS